ncbi:hypothetical protein [Actinokineospora enzanensis]|uniref:hypothetical protein n=1 Tax=Actinokineospora enzanensis TaxID=155975 RepID=UPI000376BE1E|nr:hypothetical protein [Actinokineospora enzanensis]
MEIVDPHNEVPPPRQPVTRSPDPVVLPPTAREPGSAVWCVVLFRGPMTAGRHRASPRGRRPAARVVLTVLALALLAAGAWLLASVLAPVWLARLTASVGGLALACALLAPAVATPAPPPTPVPPPERPWPTVVPLPRRPDEAQLSRPAWRAAGLPRERRVIPAASSVSRTLA